MKSSKIPIKTVKLLLALFYLLSLLVQVLVLLRVIPYTIVNGGMSPSYEAQFIQSVISVVILSLLFLFVWGLARYSNKVKKWQKWVLYTITALWVLGFFLQILGTDFERYVLSPTLLLGAVSHTLLIRHVRQNEGL